MTFTITTFPSWPPQKSLPPSVVIVRVTRETGCLAAVHAVLCTSFSVIPRPPMSRISPSALASRPGLPPEPRLLPPALVRRPRGVITRRDGLFSGLRWKRGGTRTVLMIALRGVLRSSHGVSDPDLTLSECAADGGGVRHIEIRVLREEATLPIGMGILDPSARGASLPGGALLRHVQTGGIHTISVVIGSTLPVPLNIKRGRIYCLRLVVSGTESHVVLRNIDVYVYGGGEISSDPLDLSPLTQPFSHHRCLPTPWYPFISTVIGGSGYWVGGGSPVR